MDPNANLKEQRELAAQIIRAYYGDGAPQEDDALRLAELVEALDQWLSGGGFLPDAWELGRKRAQA